ncbi:MAG: hypothetical protein PHU71_00890 [Candidatus Gracilibacteria bacterium]|nr:hypothetical protein [Candidatus Gracilibacteria bacterium]
MAVQVEATQKTSDTSDKKGLQSSFIPEKDAYLASSFSPKTLAKRQPNKDAFQKKCSLKNTKDKLLITVFMPFLKEDQALSNLQQMREGLSELNVQLVILSEEKLAGFEKVVGMEVAVLDASLENLHLALGGTDILLFPAKLKRKTFAIDLAMKYGAVPVMPESEKVAELVEDYDPSSEKGAAFLYKDDSVWSMFRALVRAWETFKLPYDWKGIQRNGMLLDLTAHL